MRGFTSVYIGAPETESVTGERLSVRSTDGRTVRVEFGPFTMDVRQARDLAYELQQAVGMAEAAEIVHERHVDLIAQCVLCRYEAAATGRQDALTDEDEDEPYIDPHEPLPAGW